MLPEQITRLADQFVLHFDTENPFPTKSRAIRNLVLGGYTARGWSGWQMGAVIDIGKELRLFVEERGKFILGKLQQIMNETRIEHYAAMNEDFKNYFGAKLKPSIDAAKGYLEQIRVEAQAPSGTTVESLRSFDNLLVGFNAEIDFFCAKHAAKSETRPPATSNVNIKYFSGIYGDVNNSQVVVSDNKAISHLFIEKNIPKHDRRELEDILDELKFAEPSKRKSLVARAEELIVKHKEALGATAEILVKTVKTALEQ